MSNYSFECQKTLGKRGIVSFFFDYHFVVVHRRLFGLACRWIPSLHAWWVRAALTTSLASMTWLRSWLWPSPRSRRHDVERLLRPTATWRSFFSRLLPRCPFYLGEKMDVRQDQSLKPSLPSLSKCNNHGEPWPLFEARLQWVGFCWTVVWGEMPFKNT